MKCSRCAAELTPSEVFCGECGQPVQLAAAAGRICPQCSTQVDANERFCGSCGHDFTVATASPQTSGAGSAVSAAPQATASASTNPILVLGLTTVVAVFLLAAAGLWLWLGSNTPGNANTPGNTNTQKTIADIAGIWNCDYLPEASEPEHAAMILGQNGTAITGTMLVVSEGDTFTIGGTFEGQVLAITSPRVLVPLTLSADEQTLNGETVDGGVKVTIVCRRPGHKR